MKKNGPNREAPRDGPSSHGARRRDYKPSREETSLMAGLELYLTERHVRNANTKLEGWRSRLLKGTKYSAHVYLDPEGQVYHSKGQVLATLQQAAGHDREEEVHVCRMLTKEEALDRARDLFERRGAELMGDRGPGAPAVQVFNLLVENLGQVDTRPGFHSSKTIFPPGYSVIRMMIDGRSLRAIRARCSIFVDRDAPAFRIEVLGSSIPEGQPTIFESVTQKDCFLKVFNALGTAGRRAKESVLGGANFFNLAVKTLIEGMPHSGDCHNYTFLATKPGRGNADIPMFKKAGSADAAKRAEKRMKNDLEQAWIKNMTNEEKVLCWVGSCDALRLSFPFVVFL